MILSANSRNSSGRLASIWRIQRTHYRAKRALANAEAAMRSVHTGLACDTSTLPPRLAIIPAPPPPPIAAAPDRVFNVTDFHRRLHFDQIPAFAIIIALVLFGWGLAHVVMAAIDPAISRVIRSAVKTAKPGEAGALLAAADGKAAGEKGVAAAPVEGPRLDDTSVVMYGGSPYPAHFSGMAAKDRKCLAEAIYYEARGEPVTGQIAVAQVVLNRILAGSWPKTVCEVTTQGVENGEKCQFSYACFKSRIGAPFGDSWHNAKALAEDVLEGGAWLEEMLRATHFHRSDLKPVWRMAMTEIGRYGRHTFYTSPTEIRRPLGKQAVR